MKLTLCLHKGVHEPGIKTADVPGSEHAVKTKNNRWMSKAKCAVCGETKTRFVTAAEAQKIQEGN